MATENKNHNSNTTKFTYQNIIMESKSSATSTPRTQALKVSISKKINGRLKNDIKELENISMPKINASLGKKSSIKDPIIKDGYISINELRTRPYHGTLGVIPVRKSQEIETLNLVMKGKNVPFEVLNQDEDEGINEPTESDTDSDNLRSNQNTPNSLYAMETLNQIPMNRQNFLNLFYNQPKPAILPSTGTTSSAKFVHRPKPHKKQKIILKPFRKPDQYNMVSLDSSKTEMEIQQEELEKEVKSMVDEAKKIAGENKKKVATKDKKNELENVPAENLQDKKVVKGVEGLITAIKSGQLLSEQEQSNKKIQEILASVLDKTSLSLFDPSFSQNLDETNQLNERSMVDSAINADSIHDSQDRQSERTMTEIFDIDNEEKVSRDFDTQTDDQMVKSIVSSYQDEVDIYLATLPPLVTKEDVLNTTAIGLKLIEKPGHKIETKNTKETCSGEKYTRNLHQFCTFEYERRDSMLLPNELLDVTRKYHVHKKYNIDRKESARHSSESFASQKSQAIFNENFISYNRTDQAARRVFDNLVDLMQFDEKKSYSTIDSGFEDSELNLWKTKAEKCLELEGKKASINSFEDYMEFTLTFLKPAPPKMSVKPSRIRERLFAKYRSMPPPVLDDIDFLLKKKKKKRKIFGYQSNSADDLNENESECSDQESENESQMEFRLILDKLLNRKYYSDTDLTKYKSQDELVNLTRSLSDTICLRTKRSNSQEDVYDYDFLKIDSNYNEALEEAYSQKKIIKNDYLRKTRLISASVSSLKSKTNTMSMNIEKNSDKKTDKSSVANGQDEPKKEFFPKSKILKQLEIFFNDLFIFN